MDDEKANVDMEGWPDTLVERWEKESARIAALPDGYALIDPLIWPLVVAFNLYGLETEQSCQGHTGRTRAYIDVTNLALPEHTDAQNKSTDDPLQRPNAKRLAALLELMQKKYPTTLTLMTRGGWALRITFARPNPCFVGVPSGTDEFPDLARTLSDRVELDGLLATLLPLLADAC